MVNIVRFQSSSQASCIPALEIVREADPIADLWRDHLAPKEMDASYLEHLDIIKPAQTVSEIEDDFVLIDTDELDHEIMRDLSHLRKELNLDEKYTNLLTCIYTLLSGQKIRDTQVIKFEGIKGQNRILFYHLCRTYGYTLAKTVSTRINLRNKTKICFKDIKEALISVAANVKVSDLQALFRDIKRETPHLLCSLQLTCSEKERIRNISSFQELAFEEIQILEQAFRTLPVSGKRVYTYEALECDRTIKWGKSKYQIRDEETLAHIQSIQSLLTNTYELSTSEYHAKRMSYIDLDHQSFVPVPHPEKRASYSYVINRLFNKEDGVVANLMVPLGPKDIESAEHISLNFRGTQAHKHTSNSGSSMLRDMDLWGVGKTTFDRRSKEILAMLTKYLENTSSDPVVLNLHGHSLGGTDVQRALACIIHAIRANTHPSLKKIKTFHLFAHNAPGVEASLNHQFKKDIAELWSTDGSRFIQMHYVQFEKDPVHLAGEVYLGAGTNSSWLERFVVQIDVKDLLNPIASHNSKPFTPLTDLPFSQKIVDEYTPNDLLEKLMQRNFYWDTSNKSCLNITFKLFAWYGSYTLIPLRWIFQAITYGIIYTSIKIYRHFNPKNLATRYYLS